MRWTPSLPPLMITGHSILEAVYFSYKKTHRVGQKAVHFSTLSKFVPFCSLWNRSLLKITVGRSPFLSCLALFFSSVFAFSPPSFPSSLSPYFYLPFRFSHRSPTVSVNPAMQPGELVISVLGGMMFVSGCSPYFCPRTPVGLAPIAPIDSVRIHRVIVA